jgi:hypothetical protein
MDDCFQIMSRNRIVKHEATECHSVEFPMCVHDSDAKPLADCLECRAPTTLNVSNEFIRGNDVSTEFS